MPDPQPPLAPDAHTGRKMGKYEVACRLSTGGMAEIYLAYQRGVAGFRKFVVLKQILENIRGHEDYVRMFVQEAKITAAFTHSNIAQVYDLDLEGGLLFLAMEFVPGVTLVEVAKACLGNGETIPIGFALTAVRDTALALHYAHTFTDATGRSLPVVHRDVAEKNIMVTYDGVTKLLDFGIAKRLDRVGHTQVGTVKGTSGYMSPEQLRGEELDARSDVFSLGVVLHECLSSQRLFHRKTKDEEMSAMLSEDIPPPSRRNRAVTPALDAVVLQALERDRHRRFASARDFARAIERAGADLLWEQDLTAALVQRHFASRREQTRALLSSPQFSDIHSGVHPLPLSAQVDAPTRLERALSHPAVAPAAVVEPKPGRALGEGASDVTRTVESLSQGTPPTPNVVEPAPRRHLAPPREQTPRDETPRGRRRLLANHELPTTLDLPTRPSMGDKLEGLVERARKAPPQMLIATGAGLGMAVLGLLYLLFHR